MNCPRCGLYIEDTRFAQCPRCGWNLSGMSGYPSSTQQYPDAVPPSQPPDYGTAYGPPQGAYGQAIPPYSQPYGQPVPPSTPMYPQVPQAGAPAPWQTGGIPPQGSGQPYWTPQQTPKKRGATAIIIIAVVAVVAVVGLSGLGLALYRAQSQQNPPVAAGTPGVTPSPTASVLFQDHFTDESTGWSNDSHCFYGSGGYHIKGSYICLAPTDDFTDTTITANVKQTSGSVLYGYGIAFRVQSNFDHYELNIDGNGKWSFVRCVSDKCDTLVDFTANSAIHKGLNASNTLRVTASGSHFTFYVNSAKVGQITDSRFASGAVGLTGSDQLEVVYGSFVVTKPS